MNSPAAAITTRVAPFESTRLVALLGILMLSVTGILGCASASADRPVASKTAAPQARKSQVRSSRTLYEHRDHRDLPIGTRIYFIGNATIFVRPGDIAPTKRKPDIIIIGP